MIKTILNPVLDKKPLIFDPYYKVNNEFIDFTIENNINIYYIGLIDYKPEILNLHLGNISKAIAIFSKFVIFTNEELAMYVKIKFDGFVISQEEQREDENGLG